MSNGPTDLDDYLAAYDEYMAGIRADEPSPDGLSEADRQVAERWTAHVSTLAGIDTTLSIQSPEALLARAAVLRREVAREELREELITDLEASLRTAANVTINDTDRPWDLLITVRGVALRVLIDLDGAGVATSFESRVVDVAAVLGAFPAEPSVVLVSAGEAALIERADVKPAYVTPSGAHRPAELRARVDSMTAVCRAFFDKMLLDFGAFAPVLSEPAQDLAALIDPPARAAAAVDRCRQTGLRAKIVEKAAGYTLNAADEERLERLVRGGVSSHLDFEAELARLLDAA